MNGFEEVAPGVSVRPEALRIHFVRSSGPGGQNVNKVSTKADLRVHVDDLIGLSGYARHRLPEVGGRFLTMENELHFMSDQHRTQEGNREAVMQQLRELLVKAMHRPKPRRKTKPSRGAKERRIQSKKRVGEKKKFRQGRTD